MRLFVAAAVIAIGVGATASSASAPEGTTAVVSGGEGGIRARLRPAGGTVPSAAATFPGRNGLLAFSSAVAGQDDEIQVMRSDGRGRRTLTRNSADDDAPAWSPDGRRLALVRVLPGGNSEVFVAGSGGTGVRRLTRHAGEDEDPAWSPDGRRLVFARRSGQGVGLAVMSATGGPARMLARGGFSGGPSWSPDGRRIAFHRDRGYGSEIWMVRADGTNLRQLTRLRRPPDVACVQDRWPDWSPDGKTIVFGRLSGASCEIGQLYTIRPDGSRQTKLGARNLVLDGPRYSPDGQSIVAVGPGGLSLVVLTSRGRFVRSIPIDGVAGPASWQLARS